jgi:hypothetical protein
VGSNLAAEWHLQVMPEAFLKVFRVLTKIVGETTIGKKQIDLLAFFFSLHLFLFPEPESISIDLKLLTSNP